MAHCDLRTLVCTKFDNEICNGNRTEWSPIRSVIIQVIILFNHEYDYRPNWTTRSSVTIINHNFNKICEILGSFFLKSKHKKFRDFFATSEKKIAI